MIMKYIESYDEKRESLRMFKVKILKMIDDFISYDEDFKKKHHLDYYKAFDFSYTPDSDSIKLNVKYFTNDPRLKKAVLGLIVFSGKEYEDLEKFMENPEIYKNHKKYNL